MKETRKMFERINWYRKDFVHENYSRIIYDFKDYDKISKKKMLERIYKEYENYDVIIDICTTRELKYLKKILDDKVEKSELLKDKYEWERKTLRGKFLIQIELDEVFIPDEIIDNVRLAIKNVNWELVKHITELNEILVGYCKIQGSALLDTVCKVATYITNIDEDKVKTFLYCNKLFNYYVMIYSKDIDSIGKDVEIALCHDYYSVSDELDEERSKQGLAGTLPVDLNVYKTYFYNDFDINNKKVKKMLDSLKKIPFFWYTAIDEIRKFALLNIDREPLKQSIKMVAVLKNYDLTEFFEILDDAMDEMPSGALNGFTPNEAKKIKQEELEQSIEKTKQYVKQGNAHLSKKDVDLFYKIYMALLEFTNNKYKIKPKLKIYKAKHIDIYELNAVVEKFWEEKDKIILEFCFANIYKFTKEELDITREFKNGIRGMFIIAKYEEEYTAFMSKDKVYMVKGLTDNIDEIINYQDLPLTVETSIIPFKDVLVYDSQLVQLGVKVGPELKSIVDDEYEHSIKYYHL